MTPPLLVVTSGPDKGRTFPLTAGQTLQVGRAQNTTTKLTDPTVSRLHCEIEWDGTRAMLVNKSGGGTLVNAKPAAQQELQPGDIIRVGATELRFHVSDVEEAATVVQPGKQAPAVASDWMTALIGQNLSHYTVESVIAKGATASVFNATDTHTRKPVALKVLQPEFSKNDDEMQRFVRAMKTVLPLRHPNLVTLLAAGKTGGFCWVAMEYVDGENMTQVIQRVGCAGMLDWRYGYRVAVHIARALEYAHGESILHRNVTPTNIMLRHSDKVVLLGDLMLAKALEGTLAQQITRPGELIGDVAYMSPERTRGTADVDGRSDLYGLGATVYALVAGRPPFSGATLPDLITKIRGAEPEKPQKYQMAIPGMLQGTIMRLLAKRPEERHQTATELLSDLDRVGKFSGYTV
jgi:serine/threonine protein kinase